ncbi:MAG: protein kinase, partial [Myxococcales bacterium]
GVLLYEAVSGVRPYAQTEPEKIFRAILTGRHPPLRKAARDVPPELARIIERCMKVDPKKRFADAAALKVSLETFLVACGARANPRQRLVAFLHGRRKISETEALTCIDAAQLMETAGSALKPPRRPLWRPLAAAASIAVAAGAFWAAQRPEVLLALFAN